MSRLEQLQKLAAIEPNDPLSHFGVGLELINLERWTEAAEAFAATIQCDANYSAAYFQQGRCYHAAGETDAAREALTQGVTVAHQQGDMKTVGEMRELLDSL